MPCPVPPVVLPVVVMLRAPEPGLSQKCHSTARRGGRVNRRGQCLQGFRLRKNAISGSTRRRTRCCDAQGASAVFSHNAIYRPSWWPR